MIYVISLLWLVIVLTNGELPPVVSVHYRYGVAMPETIYDIVLSSLKNSDEDEMILFTREGGWIDSAMLSHDGEQVIFAQGQSISAVLLYTFNLSNPENIVRYTSNAANSYAENYVSFSPDDSQVLVVFSSSAEEIPTEAKFHSRIAITDRRSPAEFRFLTVHEPAGSSHNDWCATFDPDGLGFLFVSDREGCGMSIGTNACVYHYNLINKVVTGPLLPIYKSGVFSCPRFTQQGDEFLFAKQNDNDQYTTEYGFIPFSKTNEGVPLIGQFQYLFTVKKVDSDFISGADEVLDCSPVPSNFVKNIISNNSIRNKNTNNNNNINANSTLLCTSYTNGVVLVDSSLGNIIDVLIEGNYGYYSPESYGASHPRSWQMNGGML